MIDLHVIGEALGARNALPEPEDLGQPGPPISPTRS
jgi:hypothetical protein